MSASLLVLFCDVFRVREQECLLDLSRQENSESAAFTDCGKGKALGLSQFTLEDRL